MTTDRGYPWLKFYVTLLDDPRFLRLSDGAKAVYLELYLLAGRADAGGLLVIGDSVASVEDLAFILHRDAQGIADALIELMRGALINQTLDGYFISRFSDEQGPAQTEKRKDWRERQAKKRAKFGFTADKALDQDRDIDREVEEEGHRDVTRDSRVTITNNPPTPFLKDGKTDHPAIKAFLSTTGHIPDKAVFERVITILGDKPCFMCMKNCYAEWVSRGYNLQGIGWLDWLPTKSGGMDDHQPIIPEGKRRPKPSNRTKKTYMADWGNWDRGMAGGIPPDHMRAFTSRNPKAQGENFRPFKLKDGSYNEYFVASFRMADGKIDLDAAWAAYLRDYIME